MLCANPIVNDEITHTAIIEAVRESTSGQILTLRKHTGELIRLTVPSIERSFQPGDSIRFNARLNIPERYDRFENDYASHIKKTGVSYTSFAAPDSVTVFSTSTGLKWRIRRLKTFLSETLGRTALNDNAYEFLNAAIIGDTSTLDNDTRQMFSAAGVAHILALSGLHTGIIAAIILFILSPINIIGLRKFRIAVTIIILWIYAVMTGLSPSVTRAVIMATTLGIGYIIGRRDFALNSLLLAAILILLIEPRQIAMPGFQMSFVAATAIILTMRLFNLGKGMTYYITSALCATIAATLCTGAIAAIHFHSFPVYFLLANLPVMAVLPAILGGGMAVIALECLSIPSSPICALVNYGCDLLFSFIRFISELPGASLQSIHLHNWVLISYFIAIALIALALYRKRKRLYILAVIGIVCTIGSFGCARKSTTPEEHFLTKAAGHTCLVYRNGNRAYLLTYAPPTVRTDAICEIERRYSDYLSLHKVKSLTPLDAPTESDEFKYDGHKIEFAGISYIFAVSDSIDEGKADYCVIVKGYRGDVLKLADKIHADTFMLGGDLDVRRHNRYADTLLIHNIPFKSLRH